MSLSYTAYLSGLEAENDRLQRAIQTITEACDTANAQRDQARAERDAALARIAVVEALCDDRCNDWSVPVFEVRAALAGDTE